MGAWAPDEAGGAGAEQRDQSAGLHFVGLTLLRSSGGAVGERGVQRGPSAELSHPGDEPGCE